MLHIGSPVGRTVVLSTWLCLAGITLFAQQNGNAPAPAAQRETAPPRETDLTVSISKVNGQPGRVVSVPVLFSRKEGTANLAKLRVRLQYPGKVLKFARLEDAYMSRRVKMAIQSNEQPDPQAQSTLELNFEVPAGEASSAQPRPQFPSGQIATLFFDIAEGAPEEIVRIPAEAWIDGEPVLPDSPAAKVEPGLVSVTVEPVYLTCFFFTH
jgi:hypothetical protein